MRANFLVLPATTYFFCYFLLLFVIIIILFYFILFYSALFIFCGVLCHFLPLLLLLLLMFSLSNKLIKGVLGPAQLNTFGFQFLNEQTKMFTSLLLKGVAPRTHRGGQRLKPVVAINAP